MPDFGNPYEDHRLESPGEKAIHDGNALVQIAIWLKMRPTKEEQTALIIVTGLVKRWWKRESP